MSKELMPIGKDAASIKLAHDIAQMLMKFVVYNQEPYSKALTEFIATGMHDVRAGIISVEIIARVQQHLDEMKKDL